MLPILPQVRYSVSASTVLDILSTALEISVQPLKHLDNFFPRLGFHLPAFHPLVELVRFPTDGLTSLAAADIISKVIQSPCLTPASRPLSLSGISCVHRSPRLP